MKVEIIIYYQGKKNVCKVTYFYYHQCDISNIELIRKSLTTFEECFEGCIILAIEVVRE